MLRGGCRIISPTGSARRGALCRHRVRRSQMGGVRARGRQAREFKETILDPEKPGSLSRLARRRRGAQGLPAARPDDDPHRTRSDSVASAALARLETVEKLKGDPRRRAEAPALGGTSQARLRPGDRERRALVPAHVSGHRRQMHRARGDADARGRSATPVFGRSLRRRRHQWRG